MYLYYDTIAEMFSLKLADGNVEFLGPMTQTMLMLQSPEYGLSESQAREATLRAIMNRGGAVPIQDVKKTAELIRRAG